MWETSDSKGSQTRQIGKAFFSSFCSSTFSMISCQVPQKLRPHSRSDYKQSSFRSGRNAFDFVSSIKISVTWSSEHGKDERRFSLIQPSDRDTLSRSSYSACNSRTEWLPGPHQPQKDKYTRAVSDFHGGAYVTLSPRLPHPQMRVEDLGRRNVRHYRMSTTAYEVSSLPST